MKTTNNNLDTNATGLTLHRPVLYDLQLRLRTLNREQSFRKLILHLAHIELGDSVLDVGCGTGTLAIAAKRIVGSVGEVYGIDPSPEMLARAEKKAKRNDYMIFFKNAFVQALPFCDARFDVVLSTLMLHHVPYDARKSALCEMKRVLKSSGKLLIVDAGTTAGVRKIRLTHNHRIGFTDFSEINSVLKEEGLTIIESGKLRLAHLQYILASNEAERD